jgi:hypothetical protein
VSRDAKERYTSRKAFQIEQTGSAMYIICFIYATSLGVVKAAYCQAAAIQLLIILYSLLINAIVKICSILIAYTYSSVFLKFFKKIGPNLLHF